MKRVVVAALLAALALPVAARAQKIGLAARAGMLGLGGEASYNFNRFLGVRAGIGAVPFQPSGNIKNVNYTIKPPSTLQNIGVDVYPLGGRWRLSGGFMFKHDISLDASPSDSIEFNHQKYSPQQAGTVTGLISWSSVAPCLTTGWSSKGKGFGMFFDFGAAFLGEPSFTFNSTGGTLSNDPSFRANLVAAQDSARQDAGKYMKILPVLSFGFRIGI